MKRRKPPSSADRFLAWFCEEEYLEEILGDLHEYHERMESQNKWKTYFRYWFHVLNFLRVYNIKIPGTTNSNIMIRSHLKTSFRTLKREKNHTFINIFGLAVGLCAFWIISHYVTYEKSYESFVEHKEDIYRVQLDVHRNGELVYQSSENYAGAGAAMKEEFPEVMEYGRFYNMGSKNNVIISREFEAEEPITIKQKRFLYADASVLSLFSYEMVRGERDGALKEPFTIVISEKMARRYFEDENPIGKTLRLKDDDFNDELCKVTGVFKDSPKNTHLKFDVLISFPTIYNRGKRSIERYKTGWGRKDYYTYVQLRPGTDPKSLEAKLPELINKFKPDLQEMGGRDILRLQPLTSIHLNSRLTDEAEVNGSQDVVTYLSIIAWFILVIAWINYINLSTAKAVNRAKEVGLRKVLGSPKDQLVWQFLVESFLVKGLAIVLGLLLLILVKPLLGDMLGVSGSISIWTQQWFWISIVALLIAGTIISGIYPAFVLSSYKPLVTIKGKFKSSSEGLALRKSLVVLQFAASVALIIGTGVIYQQMNHMQNKNLGFNADQVLVIQRPAVQDTSWQKAKSNYDAFRNGLKNESAIKGVSSTITNPGTKIRYKTGIRKVEELSSSDKPFAFNLFDYDFIDLMELEIVAGRNFSRDFVTDLDTAIMINESGAIALGFDSPEDAIGKRVAIDAWRWKPLIVGVIKDYHQEALKEKIEPIGYALRDYGNEHYIAKLATNDISKTLTKIEEIWKASFGPYPMGYFFLDEHFNSYYQAERQFSQLFLFFSLMAILVSVLGLFGLSLFNTVQRSKEIGIRKVLGASVTQIMGIFVSDVMKMILIANVIAWPLTYLVMNKWLESYPYRVELGFTLFVGAGVLILIVSGLTVGMQTLKSARTNPVNVLKDE
ncbi:MAG: ABC transporter permease [Cyclobacteriaceae bacterium]